MKYFLSVVVAHLVTAVCSQSSLTSAAVDKSDTTVHWGKFLTCFTNKRAGPCAVNEAYLLAQHWLDRVPEFRMQALKEMNKPKSERGVLDDLGEAMTSGAGRLLRHFGVEDVDSREMQTVANEARGSNFEERPNTLVHVVPGTLSSSHIQGEERPNTLVHVVPGTISSSHTRGGITKSKKYIVLKYYFLAKLLIYGVIAKAKVVLLLVKFFLILKLKFLALATIHTLIAVYKLHHQSKNHHIANQVSALNMNLHKQTGEDYEDRFYGGRNWDRNWRESAYTRRPEGRNLQRSELEFTNSISREDRRKKPENSTEKSTVTNYTDPPVPQASRRSNDHAGLSVQYLPPFLRAQSSDYYDFPFHHSPLSRTTRGSKQYDDEHLPYSVFPKIKPATLGREDFDNQPPQYSKPIRVTQANRRSGVYDDMFIKYPFLLPFTQTYRSKKNYNNTPMNLPLTSKSSKMSGEDDETSLQSLPSLPQRVETRRRYYSDGALHRYSLPPQPIRDNGKNEGDETPMQSISSLRQTGENTRNADYDDSSLQYPLSQRSTHISRKFEEYDGAPLQQSHLPPSTNVSNNSEEQHASVQSNRKGEQNSSEPLRYSLSMKPIRVQDEYEDTTIHNSHPTPSTEANGSDKLNSLPPQFSPSTQTSISNKKSIENDETLFQYLSNLPQIGVMRRSHENDDVPHRYSLPTQSAQINRNNEEYDQYPLQSSPRPSSAETIRRTAEYDNTPRPLSHSPKTTGSNRRSEEYDETSLESSPSLFQTGENRRNANHDDGSLQHSLPQQPTHANRNIDGYNDESLQYSPTSQTIRSRQFIHANRKIDGYNDESLQSSSSLQQTGENRRNDDQPDGFHQYLLPRQSTNTIKKFEEYDTTSLQYPPSLQKVSNRRSDGYDNEPYQYLLSRQATHPNKKSNENNDESFHSSSSKPQTKENRRNDDQYDRSHRFLLSRQSTNANRKNDEYDDASLQYSLPLPQTGRNRRIEGNDDGPDQYLFPLQSTNANRKIEEHDGIYLPSQPPTEAIRTDDYYDTRSQYPRSQQAIGVDRGNKKFDNTALKYSSPPTFTRADKVSEEYDHTSLQDSPRPSFTHASRNSAIYDETTRKNTPPPTPTKAIIRNEKYDYTLLQNSSPKPARANRLNERHHQEPTHFLQSPHDTEDNRDSDEDIDINDKHTPSWLKTYRSKSVDNILERSSRASNYNNEFEPFEPPTKVHFFTARDAKRQKRLDESSSEYSKPAAHLLKSRLYSDSDHLEEEKEAKEY